MTTEFGLASTTDPHIEPLGHITRDAADWTLADSRETWPDVYLVSRTSGGDWTPAEVTE